LFRMYMYVVWLREHIADKLNDDV